MKKFLFGFGLGAITAGIATIFYTQKEDCSKDSKDQNNKELQSFKASDLDDKEFYKSLYETDPEESKEDNDEDEILLYFQNLIDSI